MMAPEWLIDMLGNEDLANILTRISASLLIILLTYIVLLYFAEVVLRSIIRIAHRTDPAIDEKLVKVLNPALRNILLLVGVWLALAVLDFDAQTTEIISGIAVMLIALSFFWGIYRVIDVIADSLTTLAEKDERIDVNLIRFARQLSRALVIVVAFVVVMDQLGYNLNGLLAGLGIGGLAVALAAQDALSNLVGYFVILGDSPFSIGDFIVTDEGSGTVEHIGFRSTHIRQLDQSLVFIPNGKIAANSITNWTRLSKRRLDMNLGLTYDTTGDQMLTVVQAIRDLLDIHPRVIADSVFVQFFNFNDSSLDIRIICYINEPDWGKFQAVKEDIFIRLMRILEEHRVEIAFPTQTTIVQAPLPDETAQAVFPVRPYVMQPARSSVTPNSDLSQEQPEEGATSDEIADADAK